METGTKAPPLRLEQLAVYLDDQLEHEQQALDLLIVAQARGQAHPELWDKLHAAALRDDRLVELAGAYERLSQDRRVKIMPAHHQAQVFMHASRFFLRALGDIDAAEASLERVLTLAPGHPDAFELLKRILDDKGDREKLAQLHIGAVGAKTERDVALVHLRAALELLPPTDAERATKVAQQILRLDPGDEAALSALDERLTAAGKHAELARALEQALSSDPPMPDDRRVPIHARIVELYDGTLPDVERATPHVEAVLDADPAHEVARRVAVRLLASKSVAARAAGALEKVYEAEGDRGGVAQMLGVQIDQLRGPKKAELQKKLAIILLDLGDEAAAFSSLEAVMAVDPGDDEVRDRYVDVAQRLGKQADASKMLSRAAAAVKDPVARARVNLQTGRLIAEVGDLKRARVILQGVLDQSDGAVALDAARALRDLVESAGELKPLAVVLEAIAKLSDDADERLGVLRRLSALYESDLRDLTGAISARKRALEIDPTAEPEELERLLEARGEHKTLAEVLEIRARAMPRDEARREMLMRAARLRLDKAEDSAGAMDTLLQVLRDHGPARDVHAELIPMLDEASRTAELAEVLTAELELAPEEERLALLSRLGEALVTLERSAEALEVFAEVLAQMPDDTLVRASVLEILEHGGPETRLRATEVVAPLQRADEDLAALVRTLEVRADLHDDPRERLDALAEAFDHVVTLGKDRVKALFLAGRGLREAVTHDVDAVPSWLDRVSARAEKGPSKAAVAETLASALRDRALDHPAIARLAQRTGEAYAEAGDAGKAIDALRRVLELEPDNEEVLERIDHLLAEKGAPEERVALYRASLDRPGKPSRRQELYLAIGAVQARDLADLSGAAATLRQGLEELADASAIRIALAEVLEQAGRDDELYELLEEGLPRTAPGTEENGALHVRLAWVALRRKRPDTAATHYLEALRGDATAFDAEALTEIEEIGQAQGDVPLLVAVAERRVAAAPEGLEHAEALERLGALLGERAAEPERAAECYFGAAQSAEEAGDLDRAVADLEAVLRFSQGARPALERLVDVHRARRDPAGVLAATRRLIAGSDDLREVIALLEAPLEWASERADDILELVAGAALRLGESLELASLRARVLDAAGRTVEAAAALRAELERAGEEDDGGAEAALDAFLGERSGVAELLATRRWLLERRAASRNGDEQVDALLALAEFERASAQSPAAAAAVLDRVLEIAPTEGRALGARYELAKSAGDDEAAARCLRAWRDVETDPIRRVESAARLAELLAGSLDDPRGALDIIAGLVEEGDGPALSDAEPERFAGRLRGVLLGLMTRDGLAEEAARALEAMAEATADLAERARVYESILSGPAAEALADRKVPLFEAWLRCLEAEPEEALVVAARAMREAPEHAPFWDAAEELARSTGKPDLVAEAYRAALSNAKQLPEDVTLQLGERGVGFQEEFFDDAAAVTHMLRLLVDVVPSAGWAVERLKLVYNAAERWDELFQLYDHVIAAQADPSERALLLEDAAEIARDLAGDADKSMVYLEALLALRPSERLEGQLERLYEKHGRFQSLVDLLMGRLGRLDPAEAQATRMRVAGLLDDNVGDLDAGLEVLRPLVEAGDEAAEAVVAGWVERTAPGESTQAEWRRLSGATVADVARGALRTRMAELLLPQRERRGDHAGAAQVLAVLLESELPASERRAHLEALSNLRSAELRDVAAALQAELALLSLATEAADEKRAMSRAEKVAGKDETALRTVVEAYAELGESEADAPRSLRLLRRASALARGALADEGRAIGIDLAILSRSDQDREGAREAARQLDRTLRAAGREAERCQVLERLAILEDDAKLRREALVEAARIAEEIIGDRPRAIRSLRAWLTEAQDDLPVLTSLVDNLRALGDTQALVVALEARASHGESEDDAEADRVEIARVLARFAGDAGAAIAAYERVIDLHGATDDIVDELSDLYDAERRHHDAAALLEKEAARVAAGPRRASLFARLGDTHRKRGETAAALAALLASLDESPTGREAQEGLERLLGALSPTNPDARLTFAHGVEALAKSFEAGGLEDRWLALVPARLAASDSLTHKCDVLVAAAAAEDRRAGGDVRALEKIVQAFGIRAQHPGVAEALLARGRATGRWDLVAPCLLPSLATIDEIDVRVARDLLVLSATWASGGGTVPTAPPQDSRGLVEGLLSAALRRAPRDEEVLARLVEARRATPGLPLVQVLEALSEVRGGELESLREATTVAMKDVGDRALGLSLAKRLLSLASERLRGGDDAADHLLWSLDVCCEVQRDAGDLVSVKEALLAAADLPLPGATTWQLLSSAAEIAPPEEAAAIFERLYERDHEATDIADRLVALYEGLGRKAELASTYGRMAGASKDAAERARLRLAQARLLEELGDADGAIPVLRTTLEEVASHAPTVDLLASLLERTGRHADHAALLEQQGELCALVDPSLAADHFAAASRIAEGKLADALRAARAAKRVVDFLPSATALDRLAFLLERAGKHQEEAAVLERLAGLRGEDDELSLRVATAYGRAGQHERAREGLERALAEGRASQKVRDVLAELYRAAGAWPDLARLYAAEAELSEDLAAKLERLREAAAIYVNEIDSPAEAIPLLERAVGLKPDELPSLFALAEALGKSARHEEAKEVLARILAEFGTRKPKERALVHFELGKLSLITADRTQALVELEAASKIDPGNAAVLQLLGEVAANEGQYLRAQRTFRALLLVLRSQRTAGPAPARERPIMKTQVLVELAYLAERQKEADRRAEFVESAFEAAEQEPSEYGALVAALTHRGFLDLVARALEARLAKDDVPDAERTSTELQLAELWHGKLGKPDAARDVALRALARSPGSAPLVTRVIEIGRATGSLAAVIATLRERAAAAETALARLELWLRAAELSERDLGDDLAAAGAYEEALTCVSELEEPDPARRAQILVSLERLAERLVAAGKAPVEQHATALQGLIDLATDEGTGFGAIAQPLYRLVGLRVAEGQEDAAISLLERASREDADGDRFESVMRDAIARSPSSTALPRLLEDVARERGRGAAVVFALETLADRSEDPAPHLREAYEHAIDLEDAELTERLLRRIVPASSVADSEDVAWALSALAERRFAAGDAREAAEKWERAARVSEPDEQRALLLRVADIAREVLGEPKRTIAIYEELREREPADRDLWSPLADLYRAEGDTAALAGLIDQTIPLVDDMHERAGLRFSLAQMLETSDPERATRTLSEAIEEDPAHQEAAALLVRLYEATGRSAELLDLLERQLDVAKDAADKARVVAVGLRVAALREKAGDEDVALDAYHGVLDWDEKNLEALRAIVRIAERREDSLVQGDLLDRLLEIESGEQAGQTAVRLAELRLAGGDPEAAEKALLAGLRASPTNAVLRQQLGAIYTERDDRVGLARLAALEARGVADPQSRKELLVKAAEALRDEGALKDSADVFADAVEADPLDRDLLFSFMDACANTSQHARAIAAVDVAIERDPAGDDAWLYFSRAVLREAVGESDLALDDLERAFDQSGGGYHAELRAHLEAALVRVTRDPSASRRSELEIRLRLAEVAAHGGDGDSARLVVDEVLRRDPQNTVALRTLARIEERAERYDVAANAYAHLVGIVSGQELSECALRLAEVARKLGRPDVARGGLERAVEAAPEDPKLRAALRGVYEDSGAIGELAELIVEDARHAPEEAARFDLLMEAARLLLYGTGEASMGPAMAERSLAVIEEVRALRPDDPDVALLAADALGAAGRIDAARGALGALISAQKGKRSKELGQAYYTLYRVESRDGNVSEALTALVKAFENQPQNGGIALELGQLATDLDDQEVAQRAFRAVTIMKADGTSGVTSQDRAVAYFQLGSIAIRQGDTRRARLMLDKSLAEDPALEEAKQLLGTLV